MARGDRREKSVLSDTTVCTVYDEYEYDYIQYYEVLELFTHTIFVTSTTVSTILPLLLLLLLQTVVCTLISNNRTPQAHVFVTLHHAWNKML